MQLRFPSRLVSTLTAVLFAGLLFGFLADTAQAQIRQVTSDIRVVTPTRSDESPALRSIDPSSVLAVPRDEYEIPNKVLPSRFIQNRMLGMDRSVQMQEGRLEASAPLQNFDGLGNTDNAAVVGTRIAPPDPNIEVGQNYVVETINLIYAVYNKDGTLAMDPVPGNALWSGFGGICETHNDGDPIVLYDQEAGRWLISQFAIDGTNSHECVAISTTSDPTGTYHRYAFPMGGFNDYPKLGVGADAYYYTHNEFSGSFVGAVAGAFERDAMLAGDPDAQLVLFGPNSGRASLLPADVDGPMPAAGTPGVFAELVQDAIRLYELDVDWSDIANSTFSEIATLDVEPFDADLCSATRDACIEQPNGQSLASLAGRLMHRLQYRDMGSHSAMVVSHTVDVDGNGRGGVRWYEFRDSGSGWSVYQQGTYAPGSTLERWMPSIAINASGYIALGYSASSSEETPSIRYTARPPGAPLGTMPIEETVVFQSPTSQGGTVRWGDYTSMNVDPTNGSFWYVNQHASDANPTFNWDTRITAFQFDSGDDTPPTAINDLSAVPVASNAELTWTAPADDPGGSEPVSFYEVRYTTAGPIEDSTDFASATPAPGPPSPSAPGSQESFIVEDLDFGTQYWFAVRAVDDNFNTSLSNSPSATTGSAPVLAYSPDSLVATLETNETTTLDLTLQNTGPGDSELDFSFPAFAATELLERTPVAQQNDVSRPIGDADHAKGEDPYRGVGNPVILGAGGPDGFGYTWIDSDEPGGPSFDWIDITGSGTQVALSDESTETVGLPFNFEFYGQEWSEVIIGSNGYLSFTSTDSDYSNDPIPSPDTPNALVAPFWDDLDPDDGSGQVHYYDDEENNRFIVQYTDVEEFGGSADETYTFQVILNEDGTIRYQYLDVESGGDLEGATIGIENGAGDVGLQVAYNTAYIHDNLAVEIAAIPEFIADVVPASGVIGGGSSQTVEVTFTAEGTEAGLYERGLTLVTNDPDQQTVSIPAELTVQSGAPDIALNPASLDYGEVLVGDQAVQSFYIINNGAGPLEVSSITSSNPDFDPSIPGDLVIPFSDSAEVPVTFTPSEVGTESGTITIASDDPDEGSVTVALSGEGVPPPGIAVSPDSLSKTLEVGQTDTDMLTVTNTGESTLEFDAFFQLVPNSSLTREQVAASAPGGRGGAGRVDKLISSAGPRGMGTQGTPRPLDAMDATYQLDDGTTENALGLTDGGDVMWLNAFETTESSASIGTLYSAYGYTAGSGLPDNQPATAYVYEDPNDDGDPSDAELVAEASFELQNPHTDTFTEVDMGGAQVEGVFFIAVLIEDHAAGQYPAPIDEDSGSMQSSWIVGNGTGTFDDENLGNNSLPPALLDDVGFPGNWLLRADGGGSGGGGFPDWLAVQPFEGTVAPGESQELTVSYDASGLEVGEYSGDIQIASNDPVTPVAEVPTTLNVTTAPYPFVLSPDEITATIDKTAGDTTATAPFTIENITDEEQFFLIETRGVSGEAPIFHNFITEEAKRDYERKMAAVAQMDFESETSMEAAPGSPGSTAHARPFEGSILAPTGVTAQATSVFGDHSGQFVQFDLGDPSALTPFGSSPTAFAGDFAPGDDAVFYIIESGTNAFLQVDKETGETTQVGTATPGSYTNWSELAGDPTDGTLYGSAGSSSASSLFTIDPETGEATEVAPITVGGAPVPFVIGIAIDGDGQMWGYEISNDTWLQIDKETGEATVVGPIGFDANYAQGLDYDLETGTMYMAAYRSTGPFSGVGELRTVDLETGSTSLVGPLGSGDELGYMALPSGGFLFIDTDLISGTLAPGGDITLDANLSARGLFAGTYEAELVVISNEPGMPEDFIPVTLTVIDDPEATLQPMALDLGEVFVGGDTTGTISVVNTGGDDLEVSDIDVEPGVFSIPDSVETSFTLEPTESRSFTVTFAPDAVQTYEGSFTVSSNNPDGDVSATLTGEGIPAPVLAVDPESFDLRAAAGQTLERTLEVINEGGSPLTYQITPELVSAPGNAPAPSVVFEQVLIEQDFNNGIPNNWSVVDAYEGGVTWMLNDQADTPDDNYTGGDGTAAHADSDDNQNVPYDTELRTPMMSAAHTDYILEYKANFAQISDTLDVDITTDGGTTWTNLLRWAEDHGTFQGTPGEQVSLNLGAHLEEGDTFQIRWRYYDNDSGAWNWYAQIDDVRILREVEFLTVNPSGGTVAPSESDSVSLDINTAGLSPGTYEVDLNVTSNDPAQDTTTVPLELEVIEELIVTPEPGPDSTRTVVPGEEFLVPITVSSLDQLGVESYEFTLTFPEALFEPVGVETEGTLSEDVILSVNTSVPGQISVAAVDTSASTPDTPVLFDLEGSGTLLAVRLQAKGALGSGDLVFTQFQFNEGTPPATTEQTTYEVAPLYGDASLNGEVNVFDAVTVLDYVVGNIDLSQAAITQAEVSGNGEVGAFDAVLILDYVVGNIDCFPVEEECGSGEQPVLATTASEGQSHAAAGTFSWGQMERAPESEAGTQASTNASASSPSQQGQAIQVPLEVSGISGSVRAVELSTEVDLDKVRVEDVEKASGMPEDWMISHHITDDGQLRVALGGSEALTDGQVATVTLRWLRPDGSQADRQLSMGGEVILNEAASSQQIAMSEVSVVPDEFALPGNYPNPFSRATQVAVNLPVDAQVTLEVYDALGRRILQREQQMKAGTGRTFQIDGAPLASGVYFYRVTAESEDGATHTDTGKMILVR